MPLHPHDAAPPSRNSRCRCGRMWLPGRRAPCGWWRSYGLPLPLFMQAIHASGFQLGLMGAVRQAAMFTQLPSAFFVERAAPAQTVLGRDRHHAPCAVAGAGVFAAASGRRAKRTGWWCSSWRWLERLPRQCQQRPVVELDGGPSARGARRAILGQEATLALLRSFGRRAVLRLDPGQGRSIRPGSLLGFTVVFCPSRPHLGSADIVVHSGVIEPPPLRSAPGQSPWKRLLVPLRAPRISGA
ncbi:MAG: hypothetical protein WDN28_14765 [Chthoniobacter sp.]